MNNEGPCSVSLTSPFQVEFLQRTLHFLVQYTFYCWTIINSTILAWVIGQLRNKVPFTNTVLAIFLFDYTHLKLDGAYVA